MKGGFSKSIDV